MRACGPSGAAAETDFLAALDSVSFFHFYSFGNLSLLFGIGLGEFLFDRELDFNPGILSAGDQKCALEIQGSLAVGSFTRQVERVLAGARFECDAGQSEPCFRRGVVA